MRVLGISLVTNKVVLPGDINPVAASHEEVLATTKMRTVDVQRLVEEIISKLKSHEVVGDIAKAAPAMSTAPKSKAVAVSSSTKVEQRLRELDVSRVTPLDAIKILTELKAMVS